MGKNLDVGSIEKNRQHANKMPLVWRRGRKHNSSASFVFQGQRVNEPFCLPYLVSSSK